MCLDHSTVPSCEGLVCCCLWVGCVYDVYGSDAEFWRFDLGEVLDWNVGGCHISGLCYYDGHVVD